MKAATTSPTACLPSPRVTALRTSLRTLSLRAGEVHSLDLLENERCSLHIHEGAAWATMEGDAQDYVLTATSRPRFTGPGRLVIEAIGGDLIVQIAPASQLGAH